MQKLQLKSIYKLCKSCRFCHQEYNKIGFAILVFFYDFLWFLQATGPRGKELKNLFGHQPLERFETSPKCSWVCTRVPARIKSSHRCPSAAGDSLPAVIAGRTWSTNGTGHIGCSPERRWPVARQWLHGRCGSDSGAMWGWAKPWVAVGARVEVME
jgi:hypothetical protein